MKVKQFAIIVLSVAVVASAFLIGSRDRNTHDDVFLKYDHPEQQQVMKHFKVHARTFDGDTILINQTEDYTIDALSDTLDWTAPIRPIGFTVSYENDMYIFQLTVTNEHDIYFYQIFGSHNGADWSDVAWVWAKNRLNMTRYTLVY